jgi:hypothetical protein
MYSFMSQTNYGGGKFEFVVLNDILPGVPGGPSACRPNDIGSPRTDDFMFFGPQLQQYKIHGMQ